MTESIYYKMTRCEKEVTDDDEILVISKECMVVRIPIKYISRQGLNTMNVKIMGLNKGDKVVPVVKIIENRKYR